MNQDRPPFHVAVLFPIALLLAACGHVEELRNPRLEQAAEFNQRAQRAFMRGEYKAAASLYEQALLVDVAIENENGIAINTLNLARVKRVLGDPAQALKLLDRLLEDKALQYAPAYMAEAAVQKALLLLQQNDVTAAAQWADKADAYCSADCNVNGEVDNLRAGIALQEKDADKALRLGERAISSNGGVPLEHANALRLTASAWLLKKDGDSALKLLDLALAIDKAQGLPEKIRQDLLLTAQAHEIMGRTQLAEQYRDRAARIAATALR